LRRPRQALDRQNTNFAGLIWNGGNMNDNDKQKPEPTADERAKRLREIGDANAVYGEVGQSDEQADVNQPEPDEHM
jgi:hypothetical protein